eukprot:Transcript_12947.p2 GENE.Transcript_12947~~Transcript_12947.p2  ORF type:complete len:157 (+),score=80.97 Transcript_12947:63-473(+)
MPKRKAEEAEEEPPANLKSKAWSVKLQRINGSLGIGIDDQYYITAVRKGGAADKEGSIKEGDLITEIAGVDTATLHTPISKILPKDPDAPVKMRLKRFSAEELKKKTLTADEEAAVIADDKEGAAAEKEAEGKDED